MRRSVVVDLIANVSQWNRGMANAGRTMTQVTQQSKANVSQLSTQVGLLGAGLTGFAVLAVKRFADFDAAMSRVSSATNESAENMELLRAAALKAGADTAFSASEAADGIMELGKAGIATTDILGGALTGALDLAASEGLEVAHASELMAGALTQFNLKGTEASHVADLLAAGGGKAQGSAADLGQALAQSGLIADQFGLSIEETVGGLSLFAKNALIGSDAGTSLKTGLIALANPSKESADLMEELGVNAYDAQGQFIGLEGLAGVLQDRLSGLTDQQRNQALAQIFGTDALRVANILYKEGAAGVREMTEAVDDNGYAQEAAAKRLDNLQGDLEALGGSWETLLIGMGEGANGPLRSLVTSLTEVLNQFGEMPPAVQQATLAIVGGGGLVLLGLAGLSKMAIATLETRTAMVELGIISEATANKMSSGFKRVAATAGAVAVLIGVMHAIGQAGQDASIGVAELKQAIDETVESGSGDALFADLGNITNLDGKLRTIQQGGFLQWMSDVNVGASNLTDVWKEDEAQLGELETRLADVGVQLGQTASDDLPKAAEAFNSLIDQTDGSGESISNLMAAMPGFKDALYEIAEGAGLATDDTTLLKLATGELVPPAEAAAGAEESLGAATEDTTSAIEEQTQALEDQFKAMLDAAGAALDARSAQREFQAAIDEARQALKDNGKTLDINTEKGRANATALDNIARSGLDVVESAKENGASQKQLRGHMAEARTAFIKTAESMGVSSGKARELADKLGLIPKNVETKITADTGQAEGALDRVRRQVLNLPSGKTITVTTVQQVAQGRGGSGGTTFAGGGQVSGPGSGTSDSITARLSNGEHVWTASDVVKAGGHDAVYRLREAVQSGMLAFADGGAVRTARQQATRGRRRVISARDTLRRARRSNNERWVDRAEENLAKAEQAYEDARKRLRDLQAVQQDVRKDLRRGNLRDSVTSGLSGAYSAVDQLRSIADDPSLSQFGQRKLDKQANNAEKNLRRLYTQAEKIEAKLADARDRADELASIKGNVAGTIVGGFSLGGVEGGTNPWSGAEIPATGQQLLGAAQAYAERARVFSQKMQALQARGFKGVILQEIAAMGVEGGIAAADALLSLSTSETTQLNTAYADLDRLARTTGEIVTQGFYQGGLQAANGLVAGLESQQAAIEGQILKIAKAMEDALKKALGIKSPSTVMRNLMGFVGDGLVLGLEDQELQVGKASAALLATASGNYVAGGSASFTGASQGIGFAGDSKTIYQTNNVYYPVAEPASKRTNQKLQFAAEVS
jgi:TP901 family phage tail tape measure protein